MLETVGTQTGETLALARNRRRVGLLGNSRTTTSDRFDMTLWQRAPRRSAWLLGSASAAVLLALPSVASAHSELDPDEVAPGSIVALHLVLENESDTAGTTMVELRFPEPLVIIDLPATGCWTAQPVEGAIGAEAIGVTWTRPSADPSDDPVLPLTIGPLPDTEGQLQFKVVQTYSDGHEDAWIDDWPEGQPEPPNPGPILNLVAGAPGTVPPSSEAEQPATESVPALTVAEATEPTEATVAGTAAAATTTPSESSLPGTSPTTDCG
jgi:uncharacterized protein YcnI